MLTRLHHWWQRNFGCVYLSDDGTLWHRVGATFGKVYLYDGYFGAFPIACTLDATGWVQRNGYNTKYQWRYNPKERN